MKDKCTDEVGLKILRECSNGESLEDVCTRYGVSRDAYYRWRRLYRQRLKFMDQMHVDALHCVHAQDK